VWNRRLDAGAPLDPASGALVAELDRQRRSYGPYLNTDQWSTPIHTVGPDQPRVDVRAMPWLYGTPPAGTAAFTSVPLPRAARPARPAEEVGGDAWLVVHQPSTDTAWEFWRFGRDAAGNPTAYSGAKITGVSANPGYITGGGRYPEGGSGATGLHLPGGVILRAEALRARDGVVGAIPHALAISIKEAKASVWRWPAQRTDGTSTALNAIEEGTRFRLPATFDPSVIADPLMREIARAVRDYGMVVRDIGGSSPAFYGEDRTVVDGTDVWFGGDGAPGGPGDVFRDWPNTLLNQQFPWSQLQVVAPVPS
jgi:hypothetical protein